MVPRAGLEPARGNPRRILSPVRLPIPPPRQGIIHAVDYFKNGAGERIRTLDPLITSQMLYQLSYTGRCKWWRMTGSNRRPPACKAGALPAELILQICNAWQRPILTGGDPQLLSALKCLTSVFGMGTGVATSPSPPDIYEINIILT